MDSVRKWRRRVADADEHIRSAEKAWEEAKGELRTLHQVCHVMESTPLTSAFEDVRRSFTALKQRGRIISSFGIADWNEDTMLYELMGRSLDRLRSTETGNSRLRRAVMRTAASITQDHEVQQEDEDRFDTRLKWLRARWTQVAHTVHNENFEHSMVRLTPTITLLEGMDEAWAQEVGSNDSQIELEALKLEGMIGKKRLLTVHGTMEQITLRLLWSVSCWLGVGVARQRQMTEFLFVSASTVEVLRRRIQEVLREQEWRTVQRPEASTLSQRAITDYFGANLEWRSQGHDIGQSNAAESSR